MVCIEVEDLQDLVFCGTSDGRILSFFADTSILMQILEQPDSFPPQLHLGFGEIF